MSRSSRNKIKALITLVLSLSMLLCVGLTTLADEGDQLGSIKIQPQYNGHNVTGATSFRMYQVARVTDIYEETVAAELIEPFVEADVNLSMIRDSSSVSAAVTELKRFISLVAPEDVMVVAGGGTIEDLEPGIYMVEQVSAPANYTVSGAFLISVPSFIEGTGNNPGAWVYDLTAFPKMSYTPPDDDDDSTPTTSEPYERVTTSGPSRPTEPSQPSNLTDPTIPLVNPTTAPTVEEIPESTVPLIAPQTGMLQWPIPVLSTAGVLLIGGGLLPGRNKKKTDEEE